MQKEKGINNLNADEIISILFGPVIYTISIIITILDVIVTLTSPFLLIISSLIGLLIEFITPIIKSMFNVQGTDKQEINNKELSSKIILDNLNSILNINTSKKENGKSTDITAGLIAFEATIVLFITGLIAKLAKDKWHILPFVVSLALFVIAVTLAIMPTAPYKAQAIIVSEAFLLFSLALGVSSAILVSGFLIKILSGIVAILDLVVLAMYIFDWKVITEPSPDINPTPITSQVGTHPHGYGYEGQWIQFTISDADDTIFSKPLKVHVKTHECTGFESPYCDKSGWDWKDNSYEAEPGNQEIRLPPLDHNENHGWWVRVDVQDGDGHEAVRQEGYVIKDYTDDDISK
jgi:hypothetical protein